jgi:hypothetical protein
MPKLPWLFAEDRRRIWRREICQMDIIGKAYGPRLYPAPQGRRITQHHAPSPDFSVRGKNHANGPMDAGTRCMNSTGSISNIVLVELGPTELNRLVWVPRPVRFALRGIHEPE